MNDLLRVLVADDEKNIRSTLSICLEGLGCAVTEAASADAARAAARRESFDVVFLDLRLGTASGLDVLPDLLAANPSCAVIIITAYATFETAVEAIRKGAQDYLPKPFTPPQIEHVLKRIRHEQGLRRRVSELEDRIAATTPEADLETRSPKMRQALETLNRSAASDATVLLRGENGTGKGVLARMLHELSPRRSRPFVVVNCPALSAELLSSELFGHVQGAFTGAVRDRAGRVEGAEGGTLFLDEIGELPAELQSKLLRFLQERVYERVGETAPRKADVRLVAATNRDLEAAVREQRFREDLYFRLSVIDIALPPLRERPEDILPLARSYLDFFARSSARSGLRFSPAAEAALQGYPWPGNLRELRNAVERAVILWPAPVIEPAALPDRIASSDSGPRLGGDYSVDEIEREHIERVVARSPSLEEAARVLGIDASTLWRKRKKFEA
jgi:NtrC-family two-component system response regulator AlgB